MASPKQKSRTRYAKLRETGTRQKGATFIEEARRKQILDASVALFSKSGFDRTSLAEVGDMVGISNGVISYHFDGKRDLGGEVIRHGIRQFGHYVQDRVSKQASGRLKLLEFVSASVDYIQEHPDSYLVYTDTLRCFGTREEKGAMVAWANERQLFPLIRNSLTNAAFTTWRILTSELAKDQTDELALMFAPVNLNGTSGSPGNSIAMR